jgi:transcription-repair coupling factor (superfamily II helicase)
LGSEQSGFIADLGYETYLKILNEAVAELRNEEPTPIPSPREGSSYGQRKRQQLPSLGEGLGVGSFVGDCTLESDLEMYFPDQYVPTDSERMLLYRELDNLSTDEELQRYRQRLIDRFGTIPPQGEELMRVVPLRRLGKQLGIEKVMLKQGRMTLCFVSNPNSPYYQSDVFDKILDFVARHPRQCNFREQNGRRSLAVADVPTVEQAVLLLQQMRNVE